MKKAHFLIPFLILLSVVFSVFSADQNTDETEKKPLQVSCDTELLPFVQQWLDHYDASGQTSNLNVLGNNPSTDECLYIVSENQLKNVPGAEWQMLIGRQVVVPVIHTSHPFAADLCQNGISAHKLSEILTNGNLLTASSKGEVSKSAVNFYVSDAGVKDILIDYLKLNEEEVNIIVAEGNKSMPDLLTKDTYAIGFCNIMQITEDDGLCSGIIFLPIDRNNNGSLDYMEDIYSSLSDFNRGVWIGKYPKELSQGIFLTSAEKPENETYEFAEWLLTEGQNEINAAGFSGLFYTERHSNLAQLQTPVFMGQENTAGGSFPVILIAVIVLLAIVGVTAFLIRKKVAKNEDTHKNHTAPSALSIEILEAPAGIYYDKTHTWAFMEKNGEVRVGIDDFMQHVTGKITDITMKKTGETVKKGQPLVTLKQNGKQVTLFAPVSGTIKVKNNSLINEPEKINQSPYAEGWLYLMEPTNWLRDSALLDMAEKYKLWVVAEYTRLKDFLGRALKPTEITGVAVFQDGGEIRDGVMEEMSPQVWEEFQQRYINTSK